MAESGRPPLVGIRVVDFSRVIAGPMCTQALPDLGAEILKIGNPDGGDDTRKGAGPRAGGAAGESHFFMTYNRGKKSVALDFTKPEGQAIVHKLLADADVMVENFRPGVLKKYGLDYPSLSKRYPKLVYLSISAYGQSGPLSDRPGYDPVLQAESGMMSVNGEADREGLRHAIAIVDTMTAIHSTAAITAALYARRDTGKGQHIDLALYDTALVALGIFAAPVAAQEKLNVWFTKGFYKAEDDALDEVVKKFEAKTGVKVELSRYAVQDIIPKTSSNETVHQSEPNIALNLLPAALHEQIIIGTFGDPAGGANHPYFRTTDAGGNWTNSYRDAR